MKNKILVVEDNQTTANLLMMELKESGFNPTHAQDGHDALLKLSEHEYDAILSDLFMPNMDGMQLVDTIKSKSIEIPIIIMTGSSNVEIKSILEQKGVKHIFLKPLVDEDLSEIFSLLRSG